MKPLVAFAVGLLSAASFAQAAPVSPDGSCGGPNGYTCAGTSGTCCSQFGWCGSTPAYCGTGCNPAFGSCTNNPTTTATTATTLRSTTTSTSSTTTPTKKITPDGSCGGANGYTCAGGAFGTCCSQYGYCGSTSAYCGTGCNPAFGTCGSSSSTTTTATTTTRPSSTTSTGSTPTASVSVLQCLNGKSVPYLMSSSSGWGPAIDPYNRRLRYTPAVYVQPTTNQHVQDAVVCASQAGLKVQAKSGGHSYASFSTGGQNGAVVISLEAFNGVALDAATGVAKVGGGVRLGNLANSLWNQGGKALPHGTCPGVGVGGHATHGGYGHTSRHWGLAMDAIVKLEVVLADGSLVTASSSQNPELYWGLRGAADSLGIVTNFFFQTQDAPPSITYWEVRWGGVWATKAAFTSTLLHLQEFATNSSVVDGRISFGIYADGQGAFTPSGAFFGSVAEFNARIRPEFTRDLAAPTAFIVQSMTWIEYLVKVSGENTIVEPLTGYSSHDDFFAKSVTVPQSAGLTSAAIGSLYDYVKAGTSVSYFFIINLYGGPGSAINAKTTDFAAYNDRDSLWVIQNYGETAASIGFINGLNNAITAAQPQTTFGAYLNYVDPSLDATTAHKLYYGDAVYARLLALKKSVDPKAVFWNPQAIGAV